MLQISKVDAQIGIRTTRAQLQMSRNGSAFEMQTTHPKIEMSTERGQVHIDQRQCFNEAGLMDTETLTRSMAENGKQATMEGIARRGSEGKMLASIEKNFNAIAEIAFNNSFDQHEFNIGTIPRSRPQIDFTGGNVDIKVLEGRVEIKTNPNKPNIEYQPGKVEIFMERYPEINFNYVGNKLDLKT